MEAEGEKEAGFRGGIFLVPKGGYGKGFDEFQQVNTGGKTHSSVTSHLVSERAVNWVKKIQLAKTPPRFFAFLHLFDPHFNYQHHPDFDLTSALALQTKLKPGMTLNALDRKKSILTPTNPTVKPFSKQIRTQPLSIKIRQPPHNQFEVL